MMMLAFLLFILNMLLLAVLLLLAFPLLRVFLLLLVSLLICCDPGVLILAGGFTYWMVGNERYYNIGLSDYVNQTVFFFCYRTIGISNILLANSRNYLFGTDPDRNRVTWDIPSSEAIPVRRKPLRRTRLLRDPAQTQV